MTDQQFPVAEIAPAQGARLPQFSRMWIITLVCVLLALALVWFSIDSPGPQITIRFSQGHGLKAGDAIRHRGIDIGHVEDVRLGASLDGIEVTAVLDKDAAAIAREDSRFWIVRPQFDLTGVSGLETAVGAKYIAVAPGKSTVRKRAFDGLANAPPDGLGIDGIEIIVRGDHRYGVNPGSPVTWRGVEVGQVLSSGLSPDAMHVDTRLRITEPHRRLLSRQSKFWVTSGIRMGLDVVGGFEFNADSLAEIARGGISFITPADNDGDVQDVRPGDVFKLHDEKDDAWFDSLVGLSVLSSDPPPMAVVASRWRQTLLGIPRSHQSHASALTLKTNQGVAVLMPADLAHKHANAVDGTYQLTYTWEDTDVVLEPAEPSQDRASITSVALAADSVLPASLLTSNRIRVPQGPEDCLAIRRSWHSDDESAVVIELIGKEQLAAADGFWRCNHEKLSRDLWHGAAVVAAADEKVIGMVVVVDHEPMIIQIPTALAAP